MPKKYIELETAIALLHESEIMGIPVWNAGLARGIEKLEGLPAADVVEVVLSMSYTVVAFLPAR